MSEDIKDMIKHSKYDSVDEIITECFKRYRAEEPGWLLAQCMDEVLDDYFSNMNRGVAKKDMGVIVSAIKSLKELNDYES